MNVENMTSGAFVGSFNENKKQRTCVKVANLNSLPKNVKNMLSSRVFHALKWRIVD